LTKHLFDVCLVFTEVTFNYCIQ